MLMIECQYITLVQSILIGSILPLTIPMCQYDESLVSLWIRLIPVVHDDVQIFRYLVRQSHRTHSSLRP